MSDMLTASEKHALTELTADRERHKKMTKECKEQIKFLASTLKRRRQVQNKVASTLMWNQSESEEASDSEVSDSDSPDEADMHPKVYEAVVNKRTAKKLHDEEAAKRHKLISGIRKVKASFNVPHSNDPAASLLVNMTRLHHHMQDSVIRSQMISRVRVPVFATPGPANETDTHTAPRRAPISRIPQTPGSMNRQLFGDRSPSNRLRRNTPGQEQEYDDPSEEEIGSADEHNEDEDPEDEPDNAEEPPPAINPNVVIPATVLEVDSHLVRQASIAAGCIKCIEQWWQTHPVRRLVSYVAQRTRNPEYRLIHNSATKIVHWDGPTLQWVPCMQKCYALLDHLEQARIDLQKEIDDRRKYIRHVVETYIKTREKRCNRWYAKLPDIEKGEINKYLESREESTCVTIINTWEWYVKNADFQSQRDNEEKDIRHIRWFVRFVMRDLSEVLNEQLPSTVTAIIDKEYKFKSDGKEDHFLKRHAYEAWMMLYLSGHVRSSVVNAIADALEPYTIPFDTNEELYSPRGYEEAQKLKQELILGISFDFPIVREAEAIFCILTKQWPSLRDKDFTVEVMWDPEHNALWQEFADMVVARVSYADKTTGFKPDYKGADGALARRAHAIIYAFRDAFLRRVQVPGKPSRVYLETPDRRCTGDSVQKIGIQYWTAWQNRLAIIKSLTSQS